MMVICQTSGCANAGSPIEIEPPADPADREGWTVVCGVCGRPIELGAADSPPEP